MLYIDKAEGKKHQTLEPIIYLGAALAYVAETIITVTYLL